MTYLLDTHALLWWFFDDPQLSLRARALLADPGHRILVSSASAWEISTKHRLGRLASARELVQDIPHWIQKAGFHELAITVAHGQHAGAWPQEHRDPFDRMIAAQGASEGCPIVSRDRALAAFGVALVW